MTLSISCDFDGTITRSDTVDAILEQFALPQWTDVEAEWAAGKIGSPMRTGYCAAKHACVGYFDALRAEMEIAHGIGVSVILPGFVKTNLPFIALNGQGGLHGQADPNIDNGLPVEYEIDKKLGEGPEVHS